VVITTKNEEENIGSCLRSIKNQTYRNVEIVVVDNFSKDNTPKISKNYTHKVYLGGPERSAQRNLGISVSRGKYVLYLDADMTLSSEVVKECVRLCEERPVDALYIPERIVGEGFWVGVRDFERSFYNGTVIDAVRFFRRSLFEEAGGFDENLTGPEDADLDKRLRKIGNVGIIGAELYHNEGRFSFKKYLDKKTYYSKSYSLYVEKWRGDDADVRKQYGVWYRLFGVFFEGGKWRRLLMHPIKTIGVYIIVFRQGVVYIKWKLSAKT